MRALWVVGFSIAIAVVAPAEARDRHGSEKPWWRDSCHEEFLGGPCEVKLESKPGEFKREIKCKDGHGATWERGEWKDEYRDGACLVKIEAKRDEYKEEIKCD